MPINQPPQSASGTPAGHPPHATVVGQPGFVPAGQGYPPAGSFVPAPGVQQPPSPVGPSFTPAAPPQQEPGYLSAYPPAAPAGAPTFLPEPVSPASPPPPAPPPFRPSRNPIVRLILWVTEPSMIKGMAMGVILALVISVAFRLESMFFIASSVLTLLIVCLFGVLIGHYIFENRRKKLQRRGIDLVAQAGGELPGLSNDLLTLLWNRDRAALTTVWERLRRVRPAAQEIAGLSIAAVFRMMAMTTLFAVLGGAISFAVFLTSYMQVERMDAQNKLIATQIDQTNKQMELTEKQQSIEVALSIAERRQVTIREVLTLINNERPVLENGKRRLGGTTANLIAVAVAQLEPYRPVAANVDGGTNELQEHVRSPEQEQLVRYLSAANVDFGELDLRRAFLDHTDLQGTDLNGANLEKVRMRHVLLHDAKLAGANLALADLTLAGLARVDLSGTNLHQAKLHRANLDDAVLTEANLAAADLSGAILKKAVFKQTQLGGARLHGADLTHCDLNGADLTDADLALADLSSATMPVVPKIRAAAFWWLAIYPPDYAAKLGLDAAALARNQAGLDRIRKALDAPAIAAIVGELKAAHPSAPG
ncbi:MAG TPA: pentapeptide repeat-containing protein [Nannocystis sp.]|jgi:uncharacterized protein YjbI with pentapeptide repeats